MSNRRRYGLIIEGIGSPVPLRESIINVYVKGFIANVECKLIYQNEDIQPLQTSFVFPLDDMSAVFKFDAYLNGRHIVAECQEKEQAKRTYQDAISRGHTAMLLEEDDTSGDIFECKLGNLPGGGTAELTMGYVVELASEPPDKVRFTLPTVLNPRYTPNIGSLIPGIILPFSEDISIKAPYKMSFAASINGRHRIKSVTSSNENIDVQYNTYRTSASFQLSDLFKFDHDLTFDIVYHDVNKPEVIIEAGDTQKDGFLKDDLLMLNFLPHLKSDVNIYSNTREFIFILDRSGSMRGDRMKKSKETILLLLKSLPMNCLFNVVSFGSYYSALFTKSVEYSERTLKEALLLQRNLDADMGGTEILKPLAYIYNDKARSDYPRQIFLLTDGEVDNTNDVISLVRKNASNTRVFSFGIGDGVSTALIKGVASASYGKATFIRDKDNMQAKVMSVLKWSMEDSFCDGKIEWHLPPNISVTNIPTQLPNIFRGEKLVIFGLLSGQSETNTASGSLKLTGKLDGNTVRHSIELNTIPTFDKELPLHRVAAKRQIKELEFNDEGGTQKGLIVLVSKAANIVSKYTAFVGVDRETKIPVQLTEPSISHGVMYTCSTGHPPPLPCLARGPTPNFLSTSAPPPPPPPIRIPHGTDRRHDVLPPPPQPPSGVYPSTRIPQVTVFSHDIPQPPLPPLPLSQGPPPPPPPLSQDRSNGQLHIQRRMIISPPQPFRHVGHVGLTHPPPPPPPGNWPFSPSAPVSQTSYDSDAFDGIKKETTTNDMMIAIVLLQNLNGSWSSSNELSSLINVNIDRLESSQYPDDVWCTAVVVQYLRMKYSERRSEWEMIEMKALQWLSSKLKNLDELFNDVGKCL